MAFRSFISTSSITLLSLGSLYTSVNTSEALNATRNYLETTEKVATTQNAMFDKTVNALQEVEQLKNIQSELVKKLNMESTQLLTLEEELASLKTQRIVDVLAPCLIAGGTMWAIYFIYKYFSKSKKSNSEEERNMPKIILTFYIEKDHFSESLEEKITTRLEAVQHYGFQFKRTFSSQGSHFTIVSSEKQVIEDSRIFLTIGMKEEEGSNEVAVRKDTSGDVHFDTRVVNKLISKLQI